MSLFMTTKADLIKHMENKSTNAYNSSMKTITDTPRTDTEWSSTWQIERRLHELCQQLERELAASQAQSHGLARRVVEAETKLEAETETPRTDFCPHCGCEAFEIAMKGYKCGTEPWWDEDIGSCLVRSHICYANENSQLKAQIKVARKIGVNRYNEINTLEAQLKAEVEKAEAENQKLRELLQELIHGSTRMTKEIIDEYKQLTKLATTPR